MQPQHPPVWIEFKSKRLAAHIKSQWYTGDGQADADVTYRLASQERHILFSIMHCHQKTRHQALWSLGLTARVPARVQTGRKQQNFISRRLSGVSQKPRASPSERAVLNLPFVNCYFGDERGQKAAALFILDSLSVNTLRLVVLVRLASSLVLADVLHAPFQFSRTCLFYYVLWANLYTGAEYTKGRKMQRAVSDTHPGQQIPAI